MLRQRRPLQRKSPMKRGKARLRPRSRTKKRKPRDMAYMDFIRQQPCCVRWLHRCGAVQAHHAGVRGLGQKAPDDTCVPFCEEAHRQWHDGGPLFAPLKTKAERREWVDAKIQIHQMRYARTALAGGGGLKEEG